MGCVLLVLAGAAPQPCLHPPSGRLPMSRCGSDGEMSDFQNVCAILVGCQRKSGAWGAGRTSVCWGCVGPAESWGCEGRLKHEWL